ncbi:hypothetical protein KSP39_PZI002613 [Platanthera zijinensis]|uniref:NHL repeat-containing protein n=1 Tax=Platanthera zijinensis TaxID=2320716 RepID=A0AAP0GEF5_9ASPA
MESSENRSLHDGFPEADDPMFASRGCCCFAAPWNRRLTSSASTSANWWEQIRAPDRSGVAAAWEWASAKLRDWSELVGGPRWKNFIRRFNRNSRNPRGSTRLGAKFQYDPLSYALNFDESPDADAGFRDFSSRFAAPPLTAKSSMDLDGIESPVQISEFSVIPATAAVSGISVR